MHKIKEYLSIGTVVYIACVYFAYILYAPTIAVDALRQALQQKDAELLAKYIDFEQVRTSLKTQIKTQLILKASELHQGAGKSSDRLITEVAEAVKLVEDFVDSFLSKQGVAWFFKLETASPVEPGAVEAEKYVSQLQSKRVIGFDDVEFHSFRSIQLNGMTDQGKQLKLVLTFRYLRWVLTEVKLDLHDVDNAKVIKFINMFHPDAK